MDNNSLNVYVYLLPEIQIEKLDPRPYLRIMQRIDHKYPADQRGDLLVFMSGMKEISTLVEAANVYASQTERWIVLPLHSSLSIAEQDKVFDIAPEGVRKCIVSTNIAETSVTIDGVRFIIDSGKVKEMSYNAQAKMQQLQEFWISQASAEQRKGRAGRTGPGVCFRLYDESDFDGFQDYSTPEIQRVPLDSLALQMLSLGMKNPRVFPFIEPPPVASMETSLVFLREQGAVDANEKLTPVGTMLANLPVDVVIGKMLIMGTLFQMVEPVLCIAAALSVQSPFTNKAYHDSDAITARKPLESDQGDPFTLLSAFNEWIQVKAERGAGSRKWCKRRCLEEQRFYEMSKLKRQFRDLLKDHNMLGDGSQHNKGMYSVNERLERGRDRRKLSSLKRNKQKNPRKRKVLKLDFSNTEMDGGEEEEEEEESESFDISHLEFKLSHNMDKLQAAAQLNKRFSLRELNVLKVILCSGLYPQLAIADDCNSYRKDSDQVYHTKAKPFVVLHPNSIFANNPALLEPPPPEDDNVSLGSKGPLSNKHSLLSYVSLLETNKPYLVNTMKVPALQTILLYATSIDTNMDCTRIIADDWLEFTFTDCEGSQSLVSAVLQLRNVWTRLLAMKLKETELRDGLESPNLEIKHQERLLASKLAQFLDSDVKYTMKRTSQTELQTMYAGPLAVSDSKEFILYKSEQECFSSSCERRLPDKGLFYIWMTALFYLQVINNLRSTNRYSETLQIRHQFLFHILLSLADASADYISVLRKHWTCPICNQSMVITTLEKLEHEASCSEPEMTSSSQDQSDEAKSQGPKSLRRDYHCPICDEQFSFTTSEILKHRRDHQRTEESKVTS
ncbi:putative ATP-dependent RNA helicase DHX34 [Apostichopus japonicus]|uniref:Putative ATP-dependent RNA helicase DHX34 n=1 Tax=Stichopus japonicus TaxID=307972 RepID=A0A2G8JEC5_STIJA|nr:putative ATP-dependent RNA helicase DHX34 [Apostichopus japonicus]